MAEFVSRPQVELQNLKTQNQRNLKLDLSFKGGGKVGGKKGAEAIKLIYNHPGARQPSLWDC